MEESLLNFANKLISKTKYKKTIFFTRRYKSSLIKLRLKSEYKDKLNDCYTKFPRGPVFMEAYNSKVLRIDKSINICGVTLHIYIDIGPTVKEETRFLQLLCKDLKNQSFIADKIKYFNIKKKYISHKALGQYMNCSEEYQNENKYW